MYDKIFYTLAGVAAVAMIALSLVWPQGIGARSPAPFGHEIKLPDMYRMMEEREARRQRQEAEKAEEEAQKAAEAEQASAESASTPAP